MLVEHLLCEARKFRKEMKDLLGYTPGDLTEYVQDLGAWLNHHNLDLDFPRRAVQGAWTRSFEGEQARDKVAREVASWMQGKGVGKKCGGLMDADDRFRHGLPPVEGFDIMEMGVARLL